MTAHTTATVASQIVTSLAPPARQPAQPVRPLLKSGLEPLPRDGSMRYSIAKVDSSGQIADQDITKALKWARGDRIDITVVGTVIGAVATIRSNPAGVFALTNRGHIRLPAKVRDLLALSKGSQVLLAAAPEHDVLLIHTMAALDAMVLRHHSGGE